MGSTHADESPIFTSSLEDSSSSRSLLSRLGLPRRQRATRNVADFHIRTDEPYRKYTAGDAVRGAVILTVVKRLRITHLTVALHGYVKAFKTPSSGAGNAQINPAEIPSGNSSRFRYRGNGHATLFSDEQVLSADGPLEPRKYEFNFELEFPERTLPSSIDFERGTITYMITATLTRPTAISPTTSCERKVYLVEQVDVGLLKAPRPRTISLEPISKKSKRRRATLTGRNSTASDAPDMASDLDSVRVLEDADDNASSVSATAEGDTNHDVPQQSAPQSPIQSEIQTNGDSAISAMSGDTARSGNGDTQLRWSPGASVSGSSRRLGHDDNRTITATIEVQKGGCLPGDMITVKVGVQHIKRIKSSMHGVVVTLYRQGRIDSSPPLSVFGDRAGMSEKDVRRLERDEYYPKSRTGLGGLSLSSAGSCSVFRKDLSQSFSPLILDPTTLSASVRTSVRVPEDVFPTIKGIPGDIISFKYQVEVLVDLGGKLASQLQVNASPASGNMWTAAGANGPGRFESPGGQVSSSGSGILDTDRLRREKGVISVIHEVVVGTTDSSRQKERAGLQLPPPPISVQDRANGQGSVDGDEQWAWRGRPDYNGDAVTPGSSRDFETARPPPSPHYPLWRGPQSPSPQTTAAPFYVPPPELPDESRLSDKERLKRAEQQLLPSRPPGSAAPGRTISFADDEENIYDADYRAPMPAPSPQPGRAPLPPNHVPPEPSLPLPGEDAPTAPTAEEIAEHQPAPPATTNDDKLERERNRLLQEASAPPDFPADYDGAVAGPSSSSSAPGQPSAPPDDDLEPSAPALADDDDDGNYHGYSEPYAYGGAMAGAHAYAASGSGEPLPRYER